MGGADASLLAQHLDGCLASLGSMGASTRVLLDAIPSTYDALRNLDTFAFILLQLLSVGRRHLSAVVDLLCLI